MSVNCSLLSILHFLGPPGGVGGRGRGMYNMENKYVALWTSEI